MTSSSEKQQVEWPEEAVEALAKTLCFFQTGTVWSEADENTKATYRLSAQCDPDIAEAVAAIRNQRDEELRERLDGPKARDDQ